MASNRSRSIKKEKDGAGNCLHLPLLVTNPVTCQGSEHLKGNGHGEGGRCDSRKMCVSSLKTGAGILKHMGLGLLQPSLLLPKTSDHERDAEFPVLAWDRVVVTEIVSSS